MRQSGVCELLCRARTVIDYLSHAQKWMLMEGGTKMQKHLTVAEAKIWRDMAMGAQCNGCMILHRV
jgi:hypothetical protein